MSHCGGGSSSRPTTAGSDSSSSTLSPPPASPGHDTEFPVSAYIKDEFEHYQEEGEPASRLATPTGSPPPLKQNVSIVEKYSFKKLTPIETFERFLSDPAGLSYNKLYCRLGCTAKAMEEIQNEYLALDEELSLFREEQKRLAAEEREKNQPLLEAQKQLDDQRLIDLFDKYKVHVKGTGANWRVFQDAFEVNHADEPEGTLDLLKIARDPKKVNAARTRLNRLMFKKPELSLANVPLLDDPETVAKKGRKSHEDPNVFENQKEMDVHGTKRAARYRNRESKDADALNAEDDNAVDENGRSLRNKKRAYHEMEAEDEDQASAEELPAKRARKQRVFDQGTYTISSERGTLSREGSAVPKTFKSGKRVGRPPGAKTKNKKPSKLQSLVEHSPEALAGNQSGDEYEDVVVKGEVPFDESPPPDSSFATGEGVNSVAYQDDNFATNGDNDEQPELPVLKKSKKKREPKASNNDKTITAVAKKEFNEVLPSIEAIPKKAASRSKKRAAEDEDPYTQPPTKLRMVFKERSESMYNSRPTTSSSTGTTTTTSSMRTTRSATRAASYQPYQTMPGEGGPIIIETVYSGASKKKHAEGDDTVIKRRKTALTTEPSTGLETQSFWEGSIEATSDVASKRPRKIVAKKGSAAAKLAEVDESLLTPEELVAHRLKVKKQANKSRLLSEKTKARWASGGMGEAMTKRAATNARKKLEKTAGKLKETGERAESIGQDLGTPIPELAATPPRVKRIRKPTKKVADESEEVREDSQPQSFKSEYEHFQALASPQGINLGKRVRKTRVDLAAADEDEE